MVTQDEQKSLCSTCVILQLLEPYALHSWSKYDQLKTMAERCPEWCHARFRLKKEIAMPELTEDSIRGQEQLDTHF